MDRNHYDIAKTIHDDDHHEDWIGENGNADHFADSFSSVHHAETNEKIRQNLSKHNNSQIKNNLNNDPLASPLSESSDYNGLCCSVLTTVIDFVMTIPSQIYEPDEYEQNLHMSSTFTELNSNVNDEQHKPPLLLVPVMRIFGPIIRRQKRSRSESNPNMDNHYLNRRPYQSACLYVHGAYPYMLARPTVAGLDGSCVPTNDCPWDSPLKVQQMIETIQEMLEHAVQETNTSFLNTSNDQNNNPTSNDKKQASDKNTKESDIKKSYSIFTNHQTLRQITVVMGRGFYGYCSGPSAPFLRIEYYNPEDRWKVKRCLERGLSFDDSSSMIFTPEFFLPKPRFRREHRSEYENNFLEETGTLLRFHCFEAHIPYTMQFFKDYNLAGMSHLHVSEPIRSTKTNFDNSKDTDDCRNGPVLFRYPLPMSISASKRQQSHVDFQPWVFLESNTSKEYLWHDGLRPSLAKNTDLMSLSEKVTSSDVELDIHVSNIANQFDVMTNLPSQYEDQQQTHWRAVPSLHEIWKQERRRMSKLLPPREDFLSHDDTNSGKVEENVSSHGMDDQVPSGNPTPPFTLNVQAKDVVMPGAKLAREGMQNLVQVTHGLDDNFRRVMKQIVHRHASSIYETDSEILQNQKRERKQNNIESLTPSYDEAVEALDGLGNLFNETMPTMTCHESGITPNERISQESIETSCDSTLHGGPQNPLTQSEKARINLSQACSSSMVKHVHDSSLLDEYVLSQRVERGDGIIGNHFDNIDDVINPETLTPYDVFDDEDDDEEKEEELEEEEEQGNGGDTFHEGESNADIDEQKMTQLLTNLEEHVGFPDNTDDDSSMNYQVKNNDESSRDHKQPGRPSASNLPEKEADKIDTEHKRSPPYLSTSYEITPVVCAPTRIDVQLWCQTQRNSKRPNSDHPDSNMVRKRQRKGRDSFNFLSILDEKHSISPVDTHSVEKVDWTQHQDQTLYQEVKTSQSSSSYVSNQSLFSRETEGNNLCTLDDKILSDQLLAGIGNQGGRMFVERGGDLKAKTRESQVSQVNEPLSNDLLRSPVTIMAIEIFVQCRTGRAGINDSSLIAMTPDSLRDKISAIIYVMCEDPGGGDAFLYHNRGCIFVPVAGELDSTCTSSGPTALDNFVASARRSVPKTTLGISSHLSIECVRDERQLLLRIASIVRRNDPDMLLSWDTQAAGLGYIIERGTRISKDATTSSEVVRGIDMARLMGRTPRICSFQVAGQLRRTSKPENAYDTASTTEDSAKWNGSGLGTEWDDRVGAGAAASSICGRLVFSGWKIVAEEVKHPNCKYLQAVVSSVLHRRIPFHDNLKLSEWYGHDQGRQRWRVLHYVLVQTVACLQLFDALDIVGRSGEAARLSGVEFSQSFPGIRGSQYKVEGVLLRSLQSLNAAERGSKYGRRRASQITNTCDGLTVESKSQTQSPWKVRRQRQSKLPDNHSGLSTHDLSDRCYFFFSPSLSDTTRQEALEVQALTLEPLSGHQIDPVVVCDFTALYPSLIIAYNLCYSTIAGRLDYHSTRAEMRLEGKTTGKVGPIRYDEEITAAVLTHHMPSLFKEKKRDRAYVSPTGSIYVSESVVKGVLPQVLDEILSTRAMLKKAAKQYKKHVTNLSPSILRQLEARQLALKYVANVTYGYTSATFSGRCAMPLLADTIVECGRRTLTNAINLANDWGHNTSNKWSGIRVLYGDTDSVFIEVPGRSVNEAFAFGEEFCKAVTDSNPPPVQLKLEKVYLGSMMQTKKKYCGMKFESKDESTPTFEAKGIETVRRDQCSLTQKVLRNTLVMLYRSGIEAVKAYLCRQWFSILAGNLPVSDFILTGRVRSRYRGGRIGPVQAALARRLAEADPAKVVQHKERQAYIIVATPGLAFKLRDCVLTPMELLEQWDSYTIHSSYYITKHVNAALQRCLGLAPYDINVASWFEACPKPRQRIHFWPSTTSRQSNVMISTFFGSDKCSICGLKCKANSRSKASICFECRCNLTKSVILAMGQLGNAQKDSFALAQKCKVCNLCFEDGNTFATIRSAKNKAKSGTTKKNTHSAILVTPLANCSCIDCPTTFERHRAREKELEAIAICEALDGLGLTA